MSGSRLVCRWWKHLEAVGGIRGGRRSGCTHNNWLNTVRSCDSFWWTRSKCTIHAILCLLNAFCFTLIIDPYRNSFKCGNDMTHLCTNNRRFVGNVQALGSSIPWPNALRSTTCTWWLSYTKRCRAKWEWLYDSYFVLISEPDLGNWQRCWVQPKAPRTFPREAPALPFTQ